MAVSDLMGVITESIGLDQKEPCTIIISIVSKLVWRQTNGTVPLYTYPVMRGTLINVDTNLNFFLCNFHRYKYVVNISLPISENINNI